MAAIQDIQDVEAAASLQDVHLKNAHEHQSYSLVFKNVSFTAEVSALQGKLTGRARGTKKILHSISGECETGHVMAIIGPSGAGKTTLLEVLARQPHVFNSGNLTVGGSVEVRRPDGNNAPLDRALFSKICAFLPQEEALWPALTASENLRFASRLYEPSLSAAQHQHNVERVLRDLGLISCADTLVGSPFIKGLSGGQRRRLSLGCELLTKTHFLFLDEPTSGLDAASAASIMRLVLETATKKNVGVVCSVHQPSSHVFNSFDRVLLLSRGHTTYLGSASAAMAYFEKLGHTPEYVMSVPDFLLQIVNDDFTESASVDDLIAAWETHEVKSSDAAASVVAEPSVERVASDGLGDKLKRITTLWRRATLQYLRDPASYLLRIGMYLFMGCFLGLTYVDIEKNQQDVPQLMYQCVWLIAFFSYMGMVALPAFAVEKTIVVKEVTNGQYTLGEYCLTIALVQLPIVFVLALLALLGGYWIPVSATGINPDAGRFFAFWVVFASHLYTVESFAILVAGCIPNFILGLLVFCSAISQFFVFNGFFITPNNQPVYLTWLYYISWFSYTTQALFKISIDGQSFSGYEECLVSRRFPCFGSTGQQVLDAISDDTLKYNDVSPWAWLAILWAFTFIFRVAFYVLTRRFVY